MSFFGKWTCPNCESEWVGSIGWIMPETEEDMNNLLQTMCGCEPVDNPIDPYMSSSVMEFEESDKRQKMTTSKQVKDGIAIEDSKGNIAHISMKEIKDIISKTNKENEAKK